MRRLTLLTAAAAALTLPGVASPDPVPTRHGYIGSCNGMTSDNAGMNNAVNHANPNGIDGMIISIEKTSPFGPPDFCG